MWFLTNPSTLKNVEKNYRLLLRQNDENNLWQIFAMPLYLFLDEREGYEEVLFSSENEQEARKMFEKLVHRIDPIVFFSLSHHP